VEKTFRERGNLYRPVQSRGRRFDHLLQIRGTKLKAKRKGQHRTQSSERRLRTKEGRKGKKQNSRIPRSRRREKNQYYRTVRVDLSSHRKRDESFRGLELILNPGLVASQKSQVGKERGKKGAIKQTGQCVFRGSEKRKKRR